jgi:SAM-dependent methyltransferase
MSSDVEQYDSVADRWGAEAYADPAGYLARRAEFVVTLGPHLRPGDCVLDLACGDGGLGEHLLRAGVRYRGVDASAPMVHAARRRLGARAAIEHGDLNDYEPSEPVAATTCFRAIYYARDRTAFFRHVAGYTERKLVFDLNPRQFPLRDVERDLGAAGFTRLDVRPFFTPQRIALARPLVAALRAAERSGPLAQLLLRVRFTLLCAASRDEAARPA